MHGYQEGREIFLTTLTPTSLIGLCVRRSAAAARRFRACGALAYRRRHGASAYTPMHSVDYPRRMHNVSCRAVPRVSLSLSLSVSLCV
eukprot:COSAG05_NODE_385_length_10486_cov_12.944835_5_plen_88_part_00